MASLQEFMANLMIENDKAITATVQIIVDNAKVMPVRRADSSGFGGHTNMRSTGSLDESIYLSNGPSRSQRLGNFSTKERLQDSIKAPRSPQRRQTTRHLSHNDFKKASRWQGRCDSTGNAVWCEPMRLPTRSCESSDKSKSIAIKKKLANAPIVPIQVLPTVQQVPETKRQQPISISSGKKCPAPTFDTGQNLINTIQRLSMQAAAALTKEGPSWCEGESIVATPIGVVPKAA